MNIFVLDENPRTAAKYHCDVHVIKMTVETAQILCTVNHLYGIHKDIPYKPTHQHHPCVKWACESYQNYSWLSELGISLTKEFTFRRGKIHKTQPVAYWAKLHNPCPFDKVKGSTNKFALCMPDIYKGCSDVTSYRVYYAVEKYNMAEWTKRAVPDWFTHLHRVFGINGSCRTMGDIKGQQHFYFDGDV